MRGMLFGTLAGLAALMAGAGASDGKVVIPGAEGEIRPVGQPGFVHEGRLYGVIPRREGNQGEITYRVNVKRSPQPRVEHILNRDVAIKWEAEGKLAIDGIGKRTQDADELLATATFKAERESQWGKAHDVRCVLSWPVAGGGGSSSQRSGMTLTGHIVAPEVKLKELSFNHRPGENASDAIDLVAKAGDKEPSAVVPEYVAGREVNNAFAYVAGVKPTVQAVFEVWPKFVPSMTVSSPTTGKYDFDNRYQILDELLEAEAKPTGGVQTVSGGSGAFVALLQAKTSILHVVSGNTVTLPWRVESMANVKLSGKYWEEFTTTKHEKVYTLLGAPRLPWKDGAGHGKTYPWFGALEFVIGPNGKEQQYGAHGAVDGHDAMKKITKYLFEGLGKVYDHVGGNSTLYSGGTWNFDKYISTESGKVNCHDQSTALNTCARLLGIESCRVYKGCRYFKQGGNDGRFFGYIQQLRFVGSPAGVLCNNPFFLAPEQRGVGRLVDPDDLRREPFANHGFVRLGTVYYDCCAGPIMGVETLDLYCEMVVDNFSLDEKKRNEKMAKSTGEAEDRPFTPITR